MSVSSTAAAFCVSVVNLNFSLNIANIDEKHRQNWFENVPNITAIPPASIEDGLDIWVYKSQPDLNSTPPITKPLLVDCPMPVCAFGISGPYAALQRYLIYTNLALAFLAAAAPVLRGVAQLFLVTTSLSATIHFWVIVNRQYEGFVDMDLLPALSYSLSGVVATYIWILLRSPQLKHWILHIVLPFFFALIYFPVTVIVLHYYNNKPWAVLLQSDTAFRLTSVCYKASDGSVAVWSGQFQSGIRQISELQFLTPPDGNDGKSVVVSPIPLSATTMMLLAVIIAQLGALLIPGIMKCCSARGCRMEIDVSYLEFLPTWILRLFSPGFQSPDWVRGRRVVLGTEFFFALFLFVPGLIIYVVYLIFLEYGIRKHKLPEGEAPHQYSQWGTWVIAVFVAFATIIIQAQAGPFESADDEEDESLVRIQDRRSRIGNGFVRLRRTWA